MNTINPMDKAAFLDTLDWALSQGQPTQEEVPGSGVSGSAPVAQPARTEAPKTGTSWTNGLQSVPDTQADQSQPGQGSFPGMGAEMKERLTSGGLQLGKMMADTPGFLYDIAAVPQNLAADKLNLPALATSSDVLARTVGVESNPVSEYYGEEIAKSQGRVAKLNPKFQQGIIESFKAGDIDAGLRNLAGGILESMAPSMAIMASGGTLGPAGTVGVGTALFGAGKQDEIDQQAPNMPEWKKSVVATSNGMIEGLFETALGAGAVGKAFKNVITGSLKEGGEALAKENGKKFIGDLWARMLEKTPALAPLGEGFEEYGTQISQNAVDKYSGYKPDVKLTEGAGDALLMGMGQGGVMSGALYGAKAATGNAGPEDAGPSADAEISARVVDDLSQGKEVDLLSLETKDQGRQQVVDTLKALQNKQPALLSALSGRLKQETTTDDLNTFYRDQENGPQETPIQGVIAENTGLNNEPVPYDTEGPRIDMRTATHSDMLAGGINILKGAEPGSTDAQMADVLIERQAERGPGEGAVFDEQMQDQPGPVVQPKSLWDKPAMPSPRQEVSQAQASQRIEQAAQAGRDERHGAEQSAWLDSVDMALAELQQKKTVQDTWLDTTEKAGQQVRGEREAVRAQDEKMDGWLADIEQARPEVVQQVPAADEVPQASSVVRDEKNLERRDVQAKVQDVLNEPPMPKEEDFPSAREHLAAVQAWREETGNTNAYEQKREDRADRMEERAGKARQSSDARFQAVQKMADQIPFGQPILVGHHSEGKSRRREQKMHNGMDKAVGEQKKADYYDRRAESARSNKAISSDDEDAIIKLGAKVEAAQELQDKMKATNKAVRKKNVQTGDAELQEMGYSPEQIAKLREPGIGSRNGGFPGFTLSNNNANINRMKKRLESLKKAQGQKTEEFVFEGGTVVDDVPGNRVRIFYDAKPDADTRTLLRRNGFLWAPSTGSWQKRRGRWNLDRAKEVTGATAKVAEVQEVPTPIKEIHDGTKPTSENTPLPDNSQGDGGGQGGDVAGTPAPADQAERAQGDTGRRRKTKIERLEEELTGFKTAFADEAIDADTRAAIWSDIARTRAEIESVEALAADKQAAMLVRDSHLDVYNRTIVRIWDMGGLNFDSVKNHAGNEGVQWMRSRYGIGFVAHKGEPLDTLVQALEETAPDLQLNGDIDALWDFLETTQSKKQIAQEYSAAILASKEADTSEVNEPLGDDAPFSKSTAKAEADIRKQDAQLAVDAITIAWKNPCPINVVQSEKELPVGLYGEIVKDEASGEVRGVYYQGEAYIVADNLKSVDEAVTTALHEVAGHHGLRSILGDMYTPVMALARTNKKVQDKALAKKNDLKIGLNLATEEVLADMAGDGVHGTWVNRVIAKVRQALRKIAPKMKFSDSEVLDLLAKARKFVVEGKKKGDGETGGGELALSKKTGTEPTDLTEAETLQAHIEKLAEEPAPRTIDSDLERDRSFANRIHEQVNLANHAVDVSVMRLQRIVQGLAGSKKSGLSPLDVLSSEKELKDSKKARDLDMAMMVYRDMQINPEWEGMFREWAADELKTVKGADRVRIKEQLRTLDMAVNLTDEQKHFVDVQANGLFDTLTAQANVQGITAQAMDNYVHRIWNVPEDKKQDTGSTGIGHGFQISTAGSRHRSFETILEGWMSGYNLKVKGLTNSYSAIAHDVATIVANKAFKKESMQNGIFTTSARTPGYKQLKASGFEVWVRKAGVKISQKNTKEPGLLGVDGNGRHVFVAPPSMRWSVRLPDSKRPARVFATEAEANVWLDRKKSGPAPITKKYAKAGVTFDQSVDVWEKVPLYAPARVADMINSMTKTAGEFWRTPGASWLLRFNASTKAWILMTSFFHHLAGSVSWMLGVNHGIYDAIKQGKMGDAAKGIGSMLNPVGAHKKGLKLVELNSPILQLGIKNGLTLGKLQDYSEELLSERDGLISRLCQSGAGRVPGAEKAHAFVKGAALFREKSAKSLFNRYFAGIKAQAFQQEFSLRVAKALRKGVEPDVELIAEQVGRVINADMGGLHLQRLGRSANLQQFFRLIMLAPDWTESNFSTVTGALGLSPLISRLTKEMPSPPGMSSRYKKFWAGIILKGVLSTAMLQMAVYAALGDDDDKPWDMWAEQMSSWDTLRKMRWLDVDVTPAYKAVGADVPAGQKRTLSIFRHFKDPLKILEFDRLIKSKASPVARIMTAYMTGTDYRGRPYTSPEELANTGRLVKKSQHQDQENIWSRSLSTSLAMIRDMQPVQFGYLLKAVAGEDDVISAGLGSMGMHMATAYTPDKVRAAYDEAGYAIRKTKRDLNDLQMNPGPGVGKEIRDYVAEHRPLLNMQARLSGTQKRLSALRKAKKQAERMPEGAARNKRLEAIRGNMTKVREGFLKTMPK